MPVLKVSGDRQPGSLGRELDSQGLVLSACVRRSSTFAPIAGRFEVSNSMKYIGGYFELELPRGGKGFHPEAIALSSGRACLAAILEHKKPRRVHLPFYMCDAVLMPMREAGVPVSFYKLDKGLAPLDLPDPDPRELVIVANYFGLQSAQIKALAKCYGSSLVADHTQAFFEKPDGGYWTFCSTRKFFGVPDGAYLYAPEAMGIRPLPNVKSDIRYLVNRLVGQQQTGYREFQRSEQNIDCCIRLMSRLSERLLAGIDMKRLVVAVAQITRLFMLYWGATICFEACLPAGIDLSFAYPFLLSHPGRQSHHRSPKDFMCRHFGRTSSSENHPGLPSSATSLGDCYLCR